MSSGFGKEKRREWPEGGQSEGVTDFKALESPEKDSKTRRIRKKNHKTRKQIHRKKGRVSG